MISQPALPYRVTVPHYILYMRLDSLVEKHFGCGFEGNSAVKDLLKDFLRQIPNPLTQGALEPAGK